MSDVNCRFCKTQLNDVFINLGESPLANSFLKKEEFETERYFPLCAYVCKNCFLVQLDEVESPKNIFSEYAYFSSYSQTWLKHAKDYVDMILEEFPINQSSLVIEIASNDGYLLQYFREKNIPVMGIEPASNIADVAIEKNIPTMKKFFDYKTAIDLSKDNKCADLIIANNVLAHVPNLLSFLKGLKKLLKSNGIITLEFPHLLKLIKDNQFDTIYHEHFSYFSLITLEKIFEFYDMKIFDVNEISTHGGSLRIFVTHKTNENYKINERVLKLLRKEKKFGLDQIKTYQTFSNNAREIKTQLLNFLTKAKKESKTIVAYGAAAKGNTLLNYCKVETSLIDYVVDKNEYKQGLCLPGSHLPIKDPQTVYETKPDYLLILPWNLKDEIMFQMEGIREWGGKFIVPIPEVKEIT